MGIMRTSICLLVASLALVLSAVPAQAVLLYASSGNDIARFDSGATGVVTSVPVTGLQTGESLVGIDTRPATQTLYGVGSSSRLYTINPLTGVSTQVGTAGAFTLNGTAFGTDFNPVPDRIRQVSNTEQNMRLNPNDGSLAATDTALTPAGNVVGVAYSNNVPGTAATTLFGIDSAGGTLVMIGGVDGVPSPNGGTVTTVGSLGLGTNLNESIGFDIFGANTAMATITTGGLSRLYSINLTTGAATLVGTIGAGTSPFLGVTFAAIAPVPEPGALALCAAVAATVGIWRRRRLSACRPVRV